MAKKNDNLMKMVIAVSVIVFLLWLFCILKIPQFPNNTCMSLSVGGLFGGSGGSGIPAPDEVLQNEVASTDSVTLSANDDSVCQNTYQRMYITTNIPNGECAIFIAPVGTEAWQFMTGSDSLQLGANGQWSDTRQMPSGVGNYKFDAVCMHRDSLMYGVAPYITIQVKDCSETTPPNGGQVYCTGVSTPSVPTCQANGYCTDPLMACAYNGQISSCTCQFRPFMNCPTALVNGMCQCPTPYIWDTGMNRCNLNTFI